MKMKRNPEFYAYSPRKKIPSPQRGDPLVEETEEPTTRFQSARKAYVTPKLNRSNIKVSKSTDRQLPSMKSTDRFQTQASTDKYLTTTKSSERQYTTPTPTNETETNETSEKFWR